YDTAHDFAADLRRHERGEPVLARPDSAWYTLRKFVARHRVAVGSSAVVALALVIGLGTAVWQAQVARHEQARAEAVRAFLVGVFGKANPAIGLGGDARVSQLLRESEQRVATEFGGNPELAAEMYNLIAEGLWNLGQGDDAERAARLALDTATRSLSPDDLQRLRALHIIADVEVNAGRLRDAEPLLTEVIARLRASHDSARAPHLVNALAVQSLWYADQGDRPRAIGVAREAVDLARGLRPVNYPVLLTALSALADRLLVAAKYDEAVIVAREAADIAEGLYGAQRPHMLLSDAELNLGNALLRNGRPADALPLLQRVVVDTRQALGVENRQMSVALQAVGDALATQGRLQDSLLYFDGALAIEQRLSPTLTPRAISLQQRVANVRLNLREADAAAAAYDQIIRGWATMGGPLATALSRQAQIARALAWAYQGRQHEALTALQDLAASAGATPLERVWILLTQSNVERWLGRRREAVRDARQAMAQLADTAHAPRDAAGAQATLGLALLEAGEDAEARQTLQGAAQSFERLQMTRTPVAMDVALGLGRLELKAGDVQAAESHFATADTYWSKTAPESRWAGEAKYWLALARQGQGRLDDAAVLRRSARDALRRSPWMSDRRWA
ncbi:MAG: tetratricopeptide repeat protein, partial [Betaproteobacteria bacterium]|nr:tetratricopeptide repeat protein [Betaproteobacteria bacterium]